MRWARGTGIQAEQACLKRLVRYRFQLPPLAEAQLAPLVDMQWRAWRASVFDPPGTELWLLDEDRGAMLVRREQSETVLLELVVAPAYRGQGCGSAALEQLKAAYPAPYRLSVRAENPARRLYERHGFRLCEDRGTDLVLRCPIEATEHPGHE